MRKLFSKWKCKSLFIFAFFLIVSWGSCKESNYSWDFSNCEIKDILFAVSIDTGISIVPDDTVKGKGDFQFSGDDFNDAFNSFLKRCRLYVSKNNNIWTVSKFKCEIEDGKYFVDAFDMVPFEIIDKLSERVEWVITYDSLPNQILSVHFKGLNKEQLVESLTKYLGQYEIVNISNGYHLKKIKNDYDYETYNSNIEIAVEDDSYFVDVKDCGFFEVIDRLFSQGKNNGENYNYCILTNVDNKISRSVFSGNNFQETLNIICGQSGYKAELSENIYYLINDNDSKEKIVEGNKKWVRFSLSYITTDELFPLLDLKIGNIETIPLLDKSTFLCNCTKKTEELINNLIVEVDIKRSVNLISLKYLKPEELLQFLPPGIDKNNLFLADNNSQLYFRGTEAAYKNIIEQINIIDKPVKRISYDLLILQCDENSQNTWASSIGAKKLRKGDRTNLAATLGSVMGLNLNVVGVFGLNFAAELQASIEENSTKVYADTTLHGVVGKKISFQNTNTYRYRDNNVNPENGKPIYSGITKEIVTGIKIDVLGWVSGDGTITSTVTASISRQGLDTSSATGNPPPTSEKLVTTEVTCKSGEPVVLSGLVLTAQSESQKRTPFLSKIPLIGNLFKNKNETEEKSQMIIYLVPHIDEEFENNFNEDLYTDQWYEEKITKIINKTKEA